MLSDIARRITDSAKKMPGCPTLTDLETRETENATRSAVPSPRMESVGQILREKERTIEGGHRERHRGRKRRQKNIKRLPLSSERLRMLK